MRKRGSLDVMVMLAHLETEKAKISLAHALGQERQTKLLFESVSETVLGIETLGEERGTCSSTGRYVDVLYRHRDEVNSNLNMAVQDSLDAQLLYKQRVQAENSLERVIAKKVRAENRKRERKEITDMIETFQAISESEEINRALS